jgi:hypothetical protein
MLERLSLSHIHGAVRGKQGDADGSNDLCTTGEHDTVLPGNYDFRRVAGELYGLVGLACNATVVAG